MLSEIKLWNTVCMAGFPVLPSKKSDFDAFKLPNVISFYPFSSVNNNIIISMPFAYAEAPKCHRCKSVFFLQSPIFTQNGKPRWTCPICRHINMLTSNILQKHKLDLSHFSIFDFSNQSLSTSKQKKSNRNESSAKHKTASKKQNCILFIIELTTATKNPGFFHESLKTIQNRLETIEHGDISIFLVNSHLHFPIVSANSVRLVSLYEFDQNFPFPPTQNLFFHVPEQKSLLSDFIHRLDSFNTYGIDIENDHISLFKLMENFISLFQNKHVYFIFIASRIVGFESISEYKNLVLANLNSFHHFDFFLIENNPQNNFDHLRELIFITNGYFKIYRPSSIQLFLFANDFADRLNANQNHFVETTVIVPAELKIVDIYGCGVRTGLNSFSMSTMNQNDSIYYTFDYATSDIELNSLLTIQFQTTYYDSNLTPRIRMINYSISVQFGCQEALKHANLIVLLSGCINHSIDKAREEGNIEKASQILNSFSFHKQIKESTSICFTSVLRESLKRLQIPLFWPFLLGKTPLNVKQAIQPLVYQLNLITTDAKPYVFQKVINFSNNDDNHLFEADYIFEDGLYWIQLPFDNNLLFMVGDSGVTLEEIELIVQQSLPQMRRYIFFKAPIQEHNFIKVRNIINSLFV